MPQRVALVGQDPGIPQRVHLRVAVLQDLLVQLHRLVEVLLLMHAGQILQCIRQVGLGAGPLRGMCLRGVDPQGRAQRIHRHPEPDPVALVGHRHHEIRQCQVLVAQREQLRVRLLPEDLRRLGEVADDGQQRASLLADHRLARQRPRDLQVGAQFPVGGHRQPLQRYVGLPGSTRSVTGIGQYLSQRESQGCGENRARGTVRSTHGGTQLVNGRLRISTFQRSRGPRTVHHGGDLAVQTLSARRLVYLTHREASHGHQCTEFPRRLIGKPLPDTLAPDEHRAVVPAHEVIAIHQSSSLTRVAGESEFVEAQRLRPDFGRHTLQDRGGRLFGFWHIGQQQHPGRPRQNAEGLGFRAGQIHGHLRWSRAADAG